MGFCFLQFAGHSQSDIQANFVKTITFRVFGKIIYILLFMCLIKHC